MALNSKTITLNSNHDGVERLAGFSIRETAAAAAVIRLRAFSATGQILATLSFTANESAMIVLDKWDQIPAPGGTYVQAVSGTVEGVLYYRDTEEA